MVHESGLVVWCAFEPRPPWKDLKNVFNYGKSSFFYLTLKYVKQWSVTNLLQIVGNCHIRLHWHIFSNPESLLRILVAPFFTVLKKKQTWPRRSLTSILVCRDAVAQRLEGATDNRVVTGSNLTLGRLETLANSFTPLSQCLSEETLKAVGPFYLVSMPGDVKYLMHRW